jgi:hypothetical protein
MPRLGRNDLIGQAEQRNRIGNLELREVEIPEKHDVRIQDAIALVRQRHGRGDLKILLDVPSAHRLGSERPPVLASLALNHARQRPQPVRQKPGRRNDFAALALEVRE